jgi:hypothetical protein
MLCRVCRRSDRDAPRLGRWELFPGFPGPNAGILWSSSHLDFAVADNPKPAGLARPLARGASAKSRLRKSVEQRASRVSHPGLRLLASTSLTSMVTEHLRDSAARRDPRCCTVSVEISCTSDLTVIGRGSTTVELKPMSLETTLVPNWALDPSVAFSRGERNRLVPHDAPATAAPESKRQCHKVGVQIAKRSRSEPLR